jgi:MYXO-CTERM domain-containing protein
MISRASLSAVAILAAGISSATAGNYSLLTTIPITPSAANVQPGGIFSSFDISFFDPVSGLDFVADRSNAAVDIFSGASNTFVGRATGFTGQQATTSASGADGVVVVGPTHTLFAGDGNSTLKSFNVATPSAPASLFAPITTGGTLRVDEMAYAPGPNLVLVANNADTPAFGTLVNASTGAIVHANITIPGAAASDGLEQPVWNPGTGTFFISVPSFGGGTDPGGVAEIKTDGTVGRLFKLASLGITSCAPTGLALGGSGNLLVGCGNAGTQTVLLNPAGNSGTGSIVKSFTQISGSDELWFDPATNNFFATGVDGGQRAFDVISDSSDSILQSVSLPNVNAHSIAVDSLNDEVFVPLPGTTSAGADPLCPTGCIAVYAQAQAVPEPASPMTLGAAIFGLAAVRRRRRS